MSKPIMIEKAKNVSLVVLFITTVLLLYFFWGNISLDGLKSPSVQVVGKVPVTVNLLKPDQISVNFGSGNYTVLPAGDIWYNDSQVQDSFVEELDRFGPAENIWVEEITYDNYQQVMKFTSIWAEFNYNIPISDFCTKFNMTKPQSYDAIETVTAIGYSTADLGNSLFIYDGKNQRYYRLVAAPSKDSVNKTGNTEFPALIKSIEAEGYNIYYPISSYSGVENNTLVPLSVKANLKSFPYRQDTYSYQTEKITAIAEQFFGGNFDFVRKITEENGTVIYMYGYGQNVLIVNTDGSIEYKEEQLGGNTDRSFSGAMETAIDFVANHGSWESLEGAAQTPYIKEVILDPNKNEGYRFIFGMEINGNRLYYEEGDPIVVDVTSGQVTYYKRSIIDFDQEDIEAIEGDAAEDAFSAVNLIAQNSKYIYDILIQSGEIKATPDQVNQPDQTEMFESIASLVNNMETGYVKLTDEEITEIQPAWVVALKNGSEVYFDLYTADPIGYSKE